MKSSESVRSLILSLIFSIQVVTIQVAASEVCEAQFSYASLTGSSKIKSFTMERVSRQLEGIFDTLEAQYGPLLFKEGQVQGFDWEQKKSLYRDLVASARTTNEIYYLFARLLNEVKDAHVSVKLPTNYKKSLPLEFTLEEGKTFVNFVDGSEYPEDKRVPEIGDELLEMDGETPDQWRSKFFNYLSSGRLETDDKILSMSLFRRSQSKGLPLKIEKNPKSTIKLKSRETGEVYEIELEWKADGVPMIARNTDGSFEPNHIDQLFEFDQNDDASSSTEILPKSVYLKSLEIHLQHIFGLHRQLMDLESPMAKAVEDETSSNSKDDGKIEDRGSRVKIGEKKPFFQMPKDFKKIKSPLLMRPVIAASGLFAGTFKRDGKTVGFLRIPTYVPPNILMGYFAIQYIMNWFEKNVDYLVIDQTSNGGGAVVYSDWIIQGLVPEASIDKHMKFEVRPTQGFLRNFATLIDSLEDVAENEDLKGKAKEQAAQMRDKYVPLLRAEFDKVYTAYVNGDFFSEPISLFLISEYMSEMLKNLPVSVTNGNQTFEKWLLKGAKWFFGFDVNKAHHFTKPAFMYINELDFSGGDATPANLVDYGRVTTLGVNTAGAGGAVVQNGSTVQLPFTFSLTNSLMVRANGEYVENIGVAPDVPFELTIEDYVNGFEDTFERFMKEVDKLPK